MKLVLNSTTKIVLLILAVLYSLSFYFWKLPYCWDLDVDMYFWFNHCQFYADDLFNSLTLFVSHIWTSIWGYNMTMYRLLGWLCSILSITIPYCLLQSREERAENLHFLALGIWLFGYGTWGMYNNDSLSLLCLSVLTTLSIKLDAGKLVNILLLALLTALATASRFPNIVAIAPVCLYLLFQPVKVGKKLGLAILYGAFSILFYLATLGLLTGNFNVIESLKETMSANVEGSHGLGTLIKIYFSSFTKSFIPFVIALVYLWAVKKTKLTEKNSLWAAVTVAGLCLGLLLFYYKFRWIYWPLYSYCLIAMMLFGAYKYRNDRGYLPFLMIACMTVIPIAGSDTGMMKLFLLSSAFAPLVFIKLKDHLDSKLVKGLIVLALLLTTLFYNKDLIFYHHEDPSPEISEYMADFEEFGAQDKTIFFGFYKASHEMYFREQTALPYNCSFWQRTNAEAEQIVEMMKADNGLVLFDFSGREEIRAALTEEGYDIVKQSEKLTIYKKL